MSRFDILPDFVLSQCIHSTSIARIAVKYHVLDYIDDMLKRASLSTVISLIPKSSPYGSKTVAMSVCMIKG